MSARATWPAVSLILALSLLPGCREPAQPKAFPVEGILRVNGEPAGNASLAFHPLDPAATILPVGKTDSQGLFQLSLGTNSDGAPPGEYAVTIMWPDPSLLGPDECECDDPIKHDRLRGRYADRELTEIRIKIRPTENSLRIDARGPPPDEARWIGLGR